MRVIYSETSDEVTIENYGDHNHEQDENYIPGGGRENYLKWTAAQTKAVMDGIMHEATPTVIRRNLKDHFEAGSMPSATQLSNKICHCKSIFNASRRFL